ncbi:MAG: polyprenol monophosphomannose synthase [Chloroflexi bacterium]|nr:polyprenol monophosphomannose synthase [Chloroflexota bacterium]MBI3741617.1 polyprenol monophosphomannose synthase [Chloroflexota bacterium]
MKTCIILPTLNESQNIRALVQQLFLLPLDDLNILIIDDNSEDGTGKIADELHHQFPTRVFVIHRPGKMGLGTAYVTGFRWALDQGADYAIQMDADFSHSPNYLTSFIKKMNEYDVVVGSRYVPGGKLDPRWSGWRYLLSKWANSIYVRLILATQVRDATAGFKCFRRAALEKIPFERVRSNGYVFQVEMAYLSELNGLRILEVPIYFEDRRVGKSKMTVPVKLEAAWRVWEIRARYGALKKNFARVEWLHEPA